MVKAVAVLTGGKGVEGTMYFNQEEANGRFNMSNILFYQYLVLSF